MRFTHKCKLNVSEKHLQKYKMFSVVIIIVSCRRMKKCFVWYALYLIHTKILNFIVGIIHMRTTCVTLRGITINNYIF